jgi:hypothetical protein
MELTMTSEINASATSKRELTIYELDAVSGGAVSSQGLPPISHGYTPPNLDAMIVWRTLCGQYGFSPY